MHVLCRIEEVNERIEAEGMFFRDYDQDYHLKHLAPYHIFQNSDLDDCVRPLSARDIEVSIRNLRNDPNKEMVAYEARDYWFKACAKQEHGGTHSFWYSTKRKPRPS